MSHQPKFFVFEGLDGCGKSTILDKLKENFPDILYTREPGGSLFGEAMRNVLLSDVAKHTPSKAMLLGFMSARSSHIDELVIPALQKGQTVISDRCDASSFAFQLYGQENQSLKDFFWDLRTRIFNSIEVHYVYFRITPEVAYARRKGRVESNHFDSQTEEYHQRVFCGYEEFFNTIVTSHPESKYSIVDASRSVDDVYQEVCSIVCV